MGNDDKKKDSYINKWLHPTFVFIWKHITRSPTIEYISVLKHWPWEQEKKCSSMAPTVKNDYTIIVKVLQISVILVLMYIYFGKNATVLYSCWVNTVLKTEASDLTFKLN